MSDLISRQAAIDAICTEGTRLERNGTVAMVEIKQWCVDILEELPSVQPDLSEYSDKLWKAAYERGKAEAQAEIVRCKDCTFYRSDGCFFSTAETEKNGFCSWAERKTDEKENI